jgi:hypothetical protein
LQVALFIKQAYETHFLEQEVLCQVISNAKSLIFHQHGYFKTLSAILPLVWSVL